jgi:uncharacterized protein YlxW (UPF0749 family)
MSLLADLFAEEGLDPGYAAAAARRTPAERARLRRRPGRRARLFSVLLAAGLLASVAIVQVRAAEPVARRQRARLVAEIGTQTARAEAQQRELDRLREQTRRFEERALSRGQAGQDARRQLDRNAAVAAAVPHTGPGLVITVSDAPPPRSGRSGRVAEAGRLYDRDLQQLVNGLWAAGAQAISVNDRRLAATTAIRSAGQAILVDFRPVSPPYVVNAAGDPEALRESFDRTAAARHFRTLHSSFGIRFEIATEDELGLPAASGQGLRHARRGAQR